jgi:hypothetical protein
MWCIPPNEDAAFVCQREQVREVYKRPYDPKRPGVCLDEQPQQLIAQTRPPVPAVPGPPAHVDFEYVRRGVCVVWLFVEALAGWRDGAGTATKTAVDWAQRVRALVDEPRYAEAERITLVCDNLNTPTLAALYQAFGPAAALRIARKLELVHTPKQGRWRNVAGSELSVLTRQSLGRRIDTQGEVAGEASAWKERRQEKQIGVEWHFTTEDARIKLKHLYPKVKE